jgi:uncharacterized protein involved in exopolysaccharide biosynthesis
MNNEVKKEFDSTNILLFFLRWWKHLGILALVAMIAGVIVSSPLFITPLYESRAVIFPTTPDGISRIAYGTNVDFLEFGEVADAERLLQVLGSSTMRERIVERFDLYTHYDISPDSPFRKTFMRDHFNSMVKSKRTTYGAIEIKVRDSDPEMAAKIANEMSALTDTLMNEMRREKALLAYNVAKQRYNFFKEEIAQAQDTLRIIMSQGIYHYEHQAEMITRQLAIDISNNNSKGISTLEQRLEPMQLYGGQFISKRAHLDQTSRLLVTILRIKEEARADLENHISFKYTLDEAYVSEKKVYPVRWLIVFLSTFAALFFGTVVLMVYENLYQRGIIAQRLNSNN